MLAFKSTLVAKNQFGEQQNLTILGGTSQVGCNFVVDKANDNGLGLRSLKSSGPTANPDIKNVFMNTSASPAVGNPDPAAGVILVEFNAPYAGYVTGTAGFVSPLTGTPLTTVVANVLYVIVSVGTTTLTQWQAKGLPLGVVPAVGVSFVATAAGALGGTGAVEGIAAAGSGVDHVELAGDPNTTLNVTGGGYVLSQCFAAEVLTAPADGTVVGLTFDLLKVPGPQI